MSLKPISRIENFLARIAGRKDVAKLLPISRKEYFLEDIAEKAEKDRGKLNESNLFIIDLTNNGSGTYVANKTDDEIKEAFSAGKSLYANVTENDVAAIPLTFYNVLENGEINEIMFCCYKYDLDPDPAEMISGQQVIYNGTNWSYEAY